MRFLEALLLPLLCACSSDYSLGYLPQPEAVSVRTGGSPASDVFATDGQALFTFSPATGAFSPPMPFSGCELTVVEITLSDTGEMYAAGFERGAAALYRVDPMTAACTVQRTFMTPAPWSVGFLPNAALGIETLVGDTAGSVVLLDPGTRTVLGLPAASRESARDIVVGPLGQTYVSALLDWSDPASPNVLEEIDPSTGGALRTLALDSGAVIEGLAMWDGELHGFGADGTVSVLDVGLASVNRTPITTSNGPAHFTGATSHPRPDLVPH